MTVWARKNLYSKVFFKFQDFKFNLLKAIDQETRRTDMGDFRIEDIYFTGILRQKAKISKISDFRKSLITLESKFRGQTNKREYVGKKIF